MPIYELGYRPWEGPLRGALRRWMPIARTGIGLAFSSKILKRMLFIAWTPILYFGPLFFAIGYLTDPTRDLHGTGWYGFASGVLGPEIARRLTEDPESVRPAAWAMAFLYFFSVSQLILVMLAVNIVAPPLIAKDVGSKAFLLYFSKPITRAEYVVGKAGVVLFFIALITLLPGLVLYLLSIAFSPTAAAFTQTADMILRIAGASAAIAIPATFVALLFSSLTSDVRYATFGWVAFCVVGEVAYWMLRSTPALETSPWIFLLSFRETTATLTARIFDVAGQLNAIGLEGRHRSIDALISPRYSATTALTYLTGLSAFCLAVIFRRISAPMRI